MPGCSWKGHLARGNIHYCRVVLEDGYRRGVHIHYLPVLMEGKPAIGYIWFSLRTDVIGGDSFDGYISARFHDLRACQNALMSYQQAPTYPRISWWGPGSSSITDFPSNNKLRLPSWQSYIFGALVLLLALL
ncbi:hypothetical protein Tco_0414388 [Tanacetum coccineum]